MCWPTLLEKTAATQDRQPDPATAGRQEAIAAADPQSIRISRERPLCDSRATGRAARTPACDHTRGVSNAYYTIDGTVTTGTDAEPVVEAVRERTVHEPTYNTARTKLPWTANRSRGLIMDAATLPALCLVDGTALTASGARAVDPTAADRTALSTSACQPTHALP